MKQVFERIRRLLLAPLGAALAATVLLPVQSAHAADGLDSFAADFTLTRVDGDKSGLISSAESAGVARASVSDVLGSRTGRPALCHGTGLNGALKYDGFCWDDADDRTGYTDRDSSGTLVGGWMPQGFTGSHDATADGLYDGRHLYIASWYFGQYIKDDPESPHESYTRISIAQSTGDQVTYGHVALVEPVEGNFKELTYKSHADGVAWYGNRLFVANGAELQVYDLTHLWSMNDTSSGATGLSGSDGRTSARYHRWALPLVARYTTRPKATADTGEQPFPNDNPRACGPAHDTLCLSSLSIDRSTATPRLVSVENRSGGGARIVRWSLAQLGASLPTQVRSDATGYTTPVFNVQGTATDGQNYYMSGDCPSYWPSGFSCIHVARPNQPPHVLTQAPWLTESLSWDPHAGRLWGLNEALEDSAGPHRVVFSIAPDAGQAVDGWGWMSNFNKPGFVCATPEGDGTANGTVVTVWHCTGAESQRWSYVDGRLVNKASGKCLTPKGDAEGTDGAVLTLWTCNSSAPSQLFGPDGNTITNRLGKAITPKGDSLTDGTWLTLWTKSGTDPQQWSVGGF